MYLFFPINGYNEIFDLGNYYSKMNEDMRVFHIIRINIILSIILFTVVISSLFVGPARIVSGQVGTINLIDRNHKWEYVNDAKVSDLNGVLKITVNTTNPNEV